MFKKILAAIFLAIALLSTVAEAGVEEGIDVRKVQNLLAKLCYNPGPIDGAWGRKTEAAAKKFFKDNKFKYDGRLGKDQFSFLTTQAAFSNKKCTSNQNKINSSTDDKVTIFEGRSQIPDLDKQVNDATISHYYRVGDKRTVAEVLGAEIIVLTAFLISRLNKRFKPKTYRASRNEWRKPNGSCSINKRILILLSIWKHFQHFVVS